MNGLPSARGGVVTDLGLLVVLVAGAAVALLLPGVPWPVEWAFAIPLVLLLPGYALVAALFPARPDASQWDPGHLTSPGWGARAAMSLVASALVVAVVGVLLSSVGALRLVPVVLALGGVTCSGALVARIRRSGVDVDDRADPVSAASLRTTPSRLGISGVQAVTLAVAVLVLVGTLGFAGGTPTQGTAYSEASLLTNDGELLGADETLTLVSGEETAVQVRVANHEGGPTTYEIVGQLQRVGPNGTVLDQQQIDRGQVRVAAEETAVVERQIEPATTGEALRLQYLVYTGSVPDEPGSGTADLSLRLWVEATGEGAT